MVLLLVYIGPGLTGGALAAIVGILVSFFLSVIAILWYPFKKLLKYIKSKFSSK